MSLEPVIVVWCITGVDWDADLVKHCLDKDDQYYWTDSFKAIMKSVECTS